MSDQIQFITVEDIKEDTAISRAVAPELLEPFIAVAQTFHIRDVLGDSLYNQICNNISGDTLSGVNYTLNELYIKPCEIWYTYYESAPFIMYRGEAKGYTKKFSDNSTPLDKKEFEYIRQAILDKAVMYRNRLIDYLNDNSTLYPNYRSCTAKKSFSGGIFLG